MSGSDPTPTPAPAPTPAAGDPAGADPPPPTGTPIPQPVAADPAPAADERPEWINDPDKAWDALSKARDEAAKHRVKAREFNEVFDTFTPEEQQYLHGVVAGINGDDDSRARSASELARIAQVLSPAEQKVAEMSSNSDPAPASSDGDTGGETAPALTAEAVAQLMDQKMAAQAQEQAKAMQKAEFQRSIETKAKELGWDANTFEYQLWLTRASQNGGDLDAAATDVQSYRQSIVDSAVGAKKEGASRFPTQSGQTAGVPPQAQEAEWVGDMGKTRDQVLSFLASRAGDKS